MPSHTAMLKLLLPVMSLGAALQAPAATAHDRSQAPGDAPIIERTTRLEHLSITAQALPVAPAGKSLTLTVDGVERDIAPGDYSGDVVLSVTPAMPVTYLDLPAHYFRTAVLVENGAYQPEKSVPAAVVSGTVGNDAARNLVIRSQGENFNGVIVKGPGNYLLQSPVITMAGRGGNDFAGFGAAVMATDRAHLTINDGYIDTRGNIRTGLFVGGYATVDINDSRIFIHNGPLPEGYVFDFALGKMKQAPRVLGISGDARAQVLVNGTVHYKRSHIRAEGWGALSSDAPADNIRMLVEDSLIEVTESGYGAFSIGNSMAEFRNCAFDVADIALIMASRASGHFTAGTVVNSRRFGVMMFTYPRSGQLRIDGKSIFNTAETAILIKGTGGDVIIDDATINPGNGILLQAMVDDNTRAPGRPKPGEPYTKPPADPDVYASIRNADLSGDLVNSRTAQGNLHVRLENARLTGRVSSATQSPATDKKPSFDNFRLYGAVANTFGNTDGPYGTTLSIDSGSVWTVTAASYLTGLTILPHAGIVGPDGKPAHLTVNGEDFDASRPGSYVGRIVVGSR